MSEGAVPISVPGGPNIIVTGDMNPLQRRAESLRFNAEMASALVNSGAWEWFVAQCEAKAASYATLLVDSGRQIDPRDEDRHRGRVEAYRAMPRVVTDAAKKYANAVNKANKSTQEQSA